MESLYGLNFVLVMAVAIASLSTLTLTAQIYRKNVVYENFKYYDFKLLNTNSYPSIFLVQVLSADVSCHSKVCYFTS